MNYLQIEQEHEESFKRKILEEKDNQESTKIKVLEDEIKRLRAENMSLKILIESKFGNE